MSLPHHRHHPIPPRHLAHHRHERAFAQVQIDAFEQRLAIALEAQAVHFEREAFRGRGNV